MKGKYWLLLLVALIGILILGVFESQMLLAARSGTPIGLATPTVTERPTAILTPTRTFTPTSTPSPPPGKTPTPTPIVLPVQDPSKVLGIDGNPALSYPGIPWVRLGYPTCGGGKLTGAVLRDTIQTYHKQGIRVMLSICQWTSGPGLFDMRFLNDAAQGLPDAVQCGNEQMKYDPPATRYIAPDNFARFYDNCQRAMHAVRPGIPIILGALDPHVGGIDYQPLVDQVSYLDAMQQAMNSIVHPGGNWDWHTQIVGLIDSWHNGYPDASVNSLAGLFDFWSQQFNVDLNSGGLGKHLWVIEGTGCYKGCGIDSNSSTAIAISHILTLITDVNTTTHYRVPFFYFSGQDFTLADGLWPMGILDLHGHPKPLRQDLSLGARSLTLSCANGSASVVNQMQLLAKMYQGCTLPSNYVSILAN